MRELTVSKKSVGIDIGSHSLKAVVLSKKGSSVVIKSFHEVSLRRSGTPKSEQLAAAVEELSTKLKIGSAVVVTCISTQQATVRNLEIPFSEEEKTRQILKFQTEPYLAYPIEEVIIDFYNTQSAPEGRMKVLLTAIHKGVVENHLQLLSRGHIDPEVVDVDFMAVANTVVRAEPQFRDGSLTVIDVGASKTIACYIRDGRLLAVRCITLGGDAFTQAISKELGVDFEEAERVKAEVSAAADSAQETSERVHAAIAPVLERFGGELDRTLRYFSSQVRGGAFDTVVLCGGSAALPGLAPFLGDALSATVSVLSSSDTINNASGREIPFARFATALGLALRGVGESICLQNFRQEEHAYARPFRRLRKALAVSAALAVGVVALLVFSLFASLDRYSARQSNLRFLIQTKRSTIFPDKTAVDLTHMNNLLEEERHALTPFRDLARNISLLKMLADLSGRIPPEMKLEVSLFDYVKYELQQPSRARGVRSGQPPPETWAGRIAFKGTVSSVEDYVTLKKIMTDSAYVGELDDKGTSSARDNRIGFYFTLRLKETAL